MREKRNKEREKRIVESCPIHQMKTLFLCLLRSHEELDIEKKKKDLEEERYMRKFCQKE